MSLQQGARLGPYEIAAPLGAGGMGEVYRARDTRLGRDVAIKVLPQQYAADPDRLRRFEQEARAAGRLNHSNILAVFDVGTHERAPYIVTELLIGKTLQERLRPGSLPVRKAVEIAIQIARGLAEAHEKGIIHRDLKPANVFVSKDDHVKILDFGIAKLTHPEVEAGPDAETTTAGLTTEAGAVLGTAGYISPEQLRGFPADPRSDIFALGCVLYEMLSGRRAFAGATAADTAAAILSKDPPPLSVPEREIPGALQGIVSQCLEKRPEDRFSSAHDVALALQLLSGPADVMPARTPRRLLFTSLAAVVLLAVVIASWKLLWRAPAPHPQTAQQRLVRIVVLPFENLGSPEDAYFASGMTEEITSRLANVQGLGVISRTSAVGYDRRGRTVRQIGSDLGVDYVLEGSVRWERGAGRESRVRITPQLIRAADDTHAWSDRYERVLPDVFAIQSEVAGNAVKAMGVTLLPRERAALKEVSTNDLEAYQLYLRGRELESHGVVRKDLEGALRLYQAAVHRDPRFAQALAGLTRMNLLMYWEYYDRSQDRLAKAKEAAERAVELRPDLAEAHTALGLYYYQGMLDYPRALDAFAAALRIQPNNSDTLSGIGYVLRRQGRWMEAAEKFSTAADLDPKNANPVHDFGFSSILARRYAEADRALVRTLALNPQYAEVYAERAWLQLLWHGDTDKAQAILDEAGRAAGLADDAGYIAEVRLRVDLSRRDYQGALRHLQAEMRGAIDNQDGYWPIPLLRGQVHRLAGQHDLARRSFEAARLELEKRVRQDPNDHRLRSSLGIAYAGLGRREEAVGEARLACGLMPASKDALIAILRVWELAIVYAMVGRPTEAIATLDDLLARSGWWTTPHVLKLDPNWDPLRSDSRFQALLTKYEVKQ
jgi:serine/threonine protein kinase/tetratricopeptide (TPR) repeat protein